MKRKYYFFCIFFLLYCSWKAKSVFPDRKPHSCGSTLILKNKLKIYYQFYFISNSWKIVSLYKLNNVLLNGFLFLWKNKLNSAKMFSTGWYIPFKCFLFQEEIVKLLKKLKMSFSFWKKKKKKIMFSLYIL